MTNLASHTVLVSLLPLSPTVLDVGCRGFDFAAAVRKVRPAAKIHCIDPCERVAVDFRRNRYDSYHKLALAEEDAVMPFQTWHDGFGNFIERPDTPLWFKQVADAHLSRRREAQCVTITTLSEMLGVKHWDCIKLDCEASEFPVLERWPGPIATQISVEFHDYMDRDRYNAEYFERLFASLSWYDVVQHKDFAAAGNATGHWDSLLVLKGIHV